MKTDGTVKINAPPKLYGHMDHLASPAWHHLEPRLKHYLKSRNGRMMVQFSRGCPYNCGFCYNKVFNHQRHRSMSAGRIVAELKSLMEKFDINKFDVIDDNFIVKKNFIRELQQELKKENLNPDLQLSARFDVIDEDMLTILSEMGVSTLFFGVESGSESVLKKINKNQDLKQVKEVVHLLANFDFSVLFSFMFNFPFETKEDLLKTKELADYISERISEVRVWLNAYTPYPGTDLYESMKRDYGLVERITLEDWSEADWFKPYFSPQADEPESFAEIYLNMWGSYFKQGGGKMAKLSRLFKYRTSRRFERNYYVLPLEHKLLNFVRHKLTRFIP